VTALDLLIAALACWQAVEIWHHSALFARPRAWADDWKYDRWYAFVLACPFCLAVWVAFFFVLPPLTWLQPSRFPPTTILAGTSWGVIVLWQLAVYALAVSRLANLGNDLLHHWCRTPRGTLDEEGQVCKRCGSSLNYIDSCVDATCPFSAHRQDCEAGWSGYPGYQGDAVCTCDGVPNFEDDDEADA
jgi:hypothetical protein